MKRWKCLAGKALAVILSCALVFGEGSMPAYAQSETISMPENAAYEGGDEPSEIKLDEEAEEASGIILEDAGETSGIILEEEDSEINFEDEAEETAIFDNVILGASEESVMPTAEETGDKGDDFLVVSGNAAETWDEISKNAEAENTVSENIASENTVSENAETENLEENNLLLEEISEEETLLASSAEDSDNINDQNYVKWAEIINSYLVHLDDGRYMRVENLADDILVEYYNSAFQLKSTKHIKREQSLFGGFYAGKDFYYIVCGKNNTEEKDTNVVMEVLKYDTSWKEIMSAKIYGCNTREPFRAGSLRMTEQDGYLYIRTCHNMYKDSKGVNHQANWTLQLREEDMSLVDSFYEVSNLNDGYVSHSFNQFILVDDNKNLVTLDHGDAHPRSIVLGRYGKKAGEESFTGSFENKTVLAFEGAIGNNNTGASVGGFEYSSDCYLVAGNTVERGEGWNERSIRNVFVSKVNKSNLSDTTLIPITEYAEDGKVSATTPQLVKISDTRFLLMWGLLEDGKSNGKMSYVFLGADGRASSKVYTESGYVSDCKPIVVDDYVVWYATYQGKISYYLINGDGKFSALAKLGSESDSSDSTGEYFETSLIAATTATISKQYYTSKPVIPSDASVNLVVGGKRLKQGTDYEITCTNNIEIGTATAVLTGKGKYQDSKTLTFKIAARPLTKVKFDTSEFYVDSYIYDGTAKYPKIGLYVESSDGEIVKLVEGQDYILTYFDNITAGTAKAKFEGIGNYTGTKSKSFKIAKLDITYSEDFTTSLPTEYEYIKGGLIKTLKADAGIYYKGQKLKLNKDYSLLFRNYNPGKSVDGYATGTLVIKGKKNFTGKKEVTFRIYCKEMSDINITVKDKIYREEACNYKVYPSLKDTNGKSLTKKRDYATPYEYYANGKLLGSEDMVPPGTEITVVVKAAENSMYQGSVSATYRVVEKNISRAKITCVNDILYVTYDGIPLKEGVDYEVISKELNKSGRAYKVEIHGLGTYGLTKKKTVTRK